jgi:hypothetical protein
MENKENFKLCPSTMRKLLMEDCRKVMLEPENFPERANDNITYDYMLREVCLFYRDAEIRGMIRRQKPKWVKK